MENKNQPAFPVMDTENIAGQFALRLVDQGLTKRELIASQVDVSSDIADYTLKFLEAIVGRPRPAATATPQELFQWDIECEAKIKVMKADALLAELSKPQP